MSSIINGNMPATYLVDQYGNPYGIKHIDNKIRTSSTPYYVDIAKGRVSGHIAVSKFGQNNAVPATLEDVWDGSATYEYLADDTFATMYISSDAAADQSLTYEVTGIDSDYNYSIVTVTTDASDGRVFVPLTSGAVDNKWWRILRVLNTSNTAAAGNVYISKNNTDVGGDGIPDTATDIQAKILIGNEQTLMSLFTVPAGKIAYITMFYASTSSNKVTSICLFVRPFGGVFNVKAPLSINQTKSDHVYDFPAPVAAKSDIAIRAAAAGGGGIVSTGFDLWFEDV